MLNKAIRTAPDNANISEVRSRRTYNTSEVRSCRTYNNIRLNASRLNIIFIKITLSIKIILHFYSENKQFITFLNFIILSGPFYDFLLFRTFFKPERS